MNQQKAESLRAAKALLREARTGTLSVVDPETGAPFGALVNVAVDQELQPVLLTSSLSRHTQGLLKDPRASIMVHVDLPKTADPLTELRVTVTGTFAGTGDAALRQAYLDRHPYAELYAGFGDFSFWHMKPEKTYVVAGFGRVYSYAFAELQAA